MKLLSLALACSLLLTSTDALVAPVANTHKQHRLVCPRSTTTALSALEEYTPGSADDNDSFTNYQAVDDQPLAFQDTVVGTGPEATDGTLIKVAYEGRFFMSTKPRFDKGSGFVFKLGEGRVIPGWDQGVKGMRVGGKRTLRIPPKLAYGDDWYKGTIPPKSHLEFDVELLEMAETPEQELDMKLTAFGKGRAIGLVVVTAFLALSPMLS